MKSVLFLLAICLPFAIAAKTKAARLSEYLGEERYLNERPAAGLVKFVFEKVTLERKADGNTPWHSLLTKSTSYTDADNAGALKVVTHTTNGREALVNPAPVKRVEIQADPVRPRSLASTESQPSNWTLPDSAGMADQLNGIRTAVDDGAKKIGGASGALWSFWMWLFWGYLLPVLAIAAIVLMFISGVSASESLVSLRGWVVAGNAFATTHSWSAFLLACDLGLIAIVMLLHVCFWVWGATHSILLLCAAGFGAQWVARKIVSRLVPNLPVAGTSSGRAYTGQSNNPRLNG